MRLKDFEYDLPEELIAQHPLKDRDASRLMVLNRTNGSIEHKAFRDIGDYLKEGDLLILNNTKVIPTRLLGFKPTGGKIEIFLIRKTREDKEGEVWKCLAKPSKRLKPGVKLSFDGGLEAEVVGNLPDEGLWECGFKKSLEGELEKFGKVPLPPYIRRQADEADSIRYQTVFADEKGAVAAPTAGLHFTVDLLNELKKKGVDVRYITLHTGPGTFMPVRAEEVTLHKMLGEAYNIGQDVFEAVKKAKEEKRRVIAVGTTSTRALEASFKDGFDDPKLTGETDLFIYPGFRFKVIDGLLTNFHLPESTLIMLVSAFAGLENVLKAYKLAVEEKYRFFSYGDAMLII